MFDGPGILLALAAVVGPLACAWWLIGACCAPPRSWGRGGGRLGCETSQSGLRGRRPPDSIHPRRET